MWYNGFIVVFGILALLVICSVIIRLFNKSKSTIDWFLFILKQISAILSFLVLIDFLILVMLVLIIIVWGVAYYPLSWGEENLPQFWYSLLLIFSFIYFIAWLWWTGSKSFYKQFQIRKKENNNEEFSWMESVELMTIKGMRVLFPLMIIIGLVLLAITCFGALTATLYKNGNLTFFPDIEKNYMDEFLDYYLWHFLNFIPQIGVTETLKWEVPFKYFNEEFTDKGVAWLLLGFKSLMAYIIIARFYTWNKWRKELKQRTE